MAEAPFRDSAYLRGVQYKDATNLNARIALHRRFSTSSYGWMPWLFDHVLAALGPGPRRIAELGCGAGTLWKENRDGVPPEWVLTLSDTSAGMAAEAKRGLGDRARYVVCDASKLPFAASCFDVVVANHMLYHVADVGLALREVRRVLDAKGCLVASTVGDRHLAEIDDRLRALGVPESILGRQVSATFTLENGAAQLSEHFGSVEVFHYEDGLRVTEVEPMVGFVRSMTAGLELPAEAIARLREELTAEIAARGFIGVTKASGVFIVRDPLPRAAGEGY